MVRLAEIPNMGIGLFLGIIFAALISAGVNDILGSSTDIDDGDAYVEEGTLSALVLQWVVPIFVVFLFAGMAKNL